MSTSTGRWPYAQVIAHRGGGTLAPENTLAAIGVGQQHGFTAVEFDAMLARDEVPMLIHDHTLERTTGKAGAVAARTAAELAQLDAGRWFSEAFAGEAVPSLVAAIDFCRSRGIWANIEIKPSPGADSATGTIVARTVAQRYADLIRPRGATCAGIVPAVPLLSSFSRTALQAAQRAAPDVPRGYLVERLPDDWRATLESLECVSLHASHRELTRAQAAAIKDAGYWLFCYTVNDPARAHEILSWGVDAFCTDRIDLIRPDAFRKD